MNLATFKRRVQKLEERGEPEDNQIILFLGDDEHGWVCHSGPDAGRVFTAEEMAQRPNRKVIKVRPPDEI